MCVNLWGKALNHPLLSSVHMVRTHGTHLYHMVRTRLTQHGCGMSLTATALPHPLLTAGLLPYTVVNSVVNRVTQWSPARVCIRYFLASTPSTSATKRAKQRMPLPHISGSEPSEL